MVQQNKSTIYTVCYMFSKDQDEVNDLFQEVLIRLWQGFANFEGRSDVLTSSLRHPKILIKEFSYFLMPCHQHGLRINLLV